jgi:hypothetical protein
VLYKSDRKLSPRHEEVITAWWQSTKDFKQFPELDFITKARNTILKDASFPSYATRSEGSWEGAGIDYEMAHYLDGERHDLEIDVRAAMDWFERHLAKIEAQLPTRYVDDEADETDAFEGMDLTSIPPEAIAATTTAPTTEDGVMINFARRPRLYWRHGDIIEVFHKPSGRTTLTATERWPSICTWKSESGDTKQFHIERVDDHNYRVVQVPLDRAE